MDALKNIFGCDLRSLALFRIGLAVMILVDLTDRAFDLKAWHTDLGVLPRVSAIENLLDPWWVSFHLGNGSVFFEGALFLFAGIFAIMLLLGYHTRKAIIASFVLLVSLQMRNTLVLYGADMLLKMLVFWGMFLPLGARYSLDRMRLRHDAKPPDEVIFFSMGTFATLSQIIIFYVFIALHKTGVEWWSEGSAVYYALSFDQLTKALGQALLPFPALMVFLTHAVMAWQYIGSLMLIAPFSFPIFRLFALLGFLVMQLGFALMMSLGIFPWVCIVALFPLLPKIFWDKIFLWLRTKKRLALKIFYDEDCGFCRQSVSILRNFFLIPETSIVPAQSDQKMLSLMKKENSWIVVDQGKEQFRFEGVIAVMTRSPLLFWIAPFLRFPPFLWLGDKGYRLIAKRRGSVCVLPSEQSKPVQKLRASLWGQALAAFFLFYILLWNLSEVSLIGDRFQHSKWIGKFIGIDQYWNMFSPFPQKEDGWYVVPGKLADGSSVFVPLAGYGSNVPATTFDRPAQIYKTYKNQRWTKYLMNLWYHGNLHHRLPYAQYLCREWNWWGRHPPEKQLRSFEIMFLQEVSLPDGSSTKAEPIILWPHQCF